MTSNHIFAHLSILTLVLTSAWTSATAQNFLVIQADDLGTDKLGCYGLPGAANTPNLDALALGGLRFDRAYANPVCSPTRATILTGEFSHRHLIGRALSTSSPWGLDPRPATLLPKMLPASYLKVAIGKWHLGTPETGGEWHPIHCGFDLYVGSMDNFSGVPGSTYWGFPKTYASASGCATLPWTGYATDDEAADAILALQVLQATGRPWFLYLNFHAIHAPWHVPPGMTVPPSVGGAEMARAMTEYLDSRIGQVLAATPFASTTVIFTSDNGSVQGTITPGLQRWRGMKGTTYEGGIRVPLIVRDPWTAETGIKSDLVQAVDHYATLLDLAGCRIPQSADSIPWTPVLQGRAGWRSWAFLEWFTPNGSAAPGEVREAIMDDRHKIVLRTAAAPEFFDLWQDPFETTPIPLSGLTIAQAAAYHSLLTRANSLGF